MNIIEQKYYRLIKLVDKERQLEKKQSKYPNNIDREALRNVRYSIDKILKEEQIERQYLEKINQ